jgi:hypothetical protein
MNKDELQVGDLVTGRPLPGIVRDHPSIFGSCRQGNIGLVIHSDTHELRTYYNVLWFDRESGVRGNPEACEDNEVTKLEIPGE